MADGPLDYNDLHALVVDALVDSNAPLTKADPAALGNAAMLVLERLAQALDVDAIRGDPLLWKVPQPTRDRILRACLALAPIPPPGTVVVNHTTTWSITHQHGCPNEGGMPERGACPLCGVLVDTVTEGPDLESRTT